MQGGHVVGHVPEGVRSSREEGRSGPCQAYTYAHTGWHYALMCSYIHTCPHTRSAPPSVCRWTCQPVCRRVWGCPGDRTGQGWGGCSHSGLRSGHSGPVAGGAPPCSRSRLPLPGPGPPPHRPASSTEHLLFRRPRGKLASRLFSPTHDWNFPTMGMGGWQEARMVTRGPSNMVCRCRHLALLWVCSSPAGRPASPLKLSVGTGWCGQAVALHRSRLTCGTRTEAGAGATGAPGGKSPQRCCACSSWEQGRCCHAE